MADAVELAHTVLSVASGNTPLEEAREQAMQLLAEHYAKRALPVVATMGEVPDGDDVTPIYVRAQVPAEADWRTAAVCEELSLLGMAKGLRIGGILTVDIGHILEEAVGNVFPDPETAPWKANVRAQYEEYLEDQEARQIGSDDPGFLAWRKENV